MQGTANASFEPYSVSAGCLQSNIYRSERQPAVALRGTPDREDKEACKGHAASVGHTLRQAGDREDGMCNVFAIASVRNSGSYSAVAAILNAKLDDMWHD